MGIKINATDIQNIMDNAKSKLAKDRTKGNLEDLAGKNWLVLQCEIVKPLDGKPYGVAILDGVPDYYFTSSKLTKIIRAVLSIPGINTENGVCLDTFGIHVGSEEEFDTEENGKPKTIRYFPIEVVDD